MILVYAWETRLHVVASCTGFTITKDMMLVVVVVVFGYYYGVLDVSVGSIWQLRLPTCSAYMLFNLNSKMVP